MAVGRATRELRKARAAAAAAVSGGNARPGAGGAPAEAARGASAPGGGAPRCRAVAGRREPRHWPPPPGRSPEQPAPGASRVGRVRGEAGSAGGGQAAREECGRPRRVRRSLRHKVRQQQAKRTDRRPLPAACPDRPARCGAAGASRRVQVSTRPGPAPPGPAQALRARPGPHCGAPGGRAGPAVAPGGVVEGRACSPLRLGPLPAPRPPQRHAPGLAGEPAPRRARPSSCTRRRRCRRRSRRRKRRCRRRLLPSPRCCRH